MININQFTIPEKLKWKHIPFNYVMVAKGQHATYTIFKQTNVMEIEYRDKSYIGHRSVRLRARFLWLIKAIANMVELESIEIERKEDGK